MVNEKKIIEQNTKRRDSKWSTEHKRVFYESDSDSLLTLNHRFANGDSVTCINTAIRQKVTYS